ncbi:Prolyl 4-hydroxylase 1 [Diplonema papillatum]|nr:Prolyl 4-hydroxylase 1 [Diplonema papillatum]
MVEKKEPPAAPAASRTPLAVVAVALTLGAAALMMLVHVSYTSQISERHRLERQSVRGARSGEVESSSATVRQASLDAGNAVVSAGNAVVSAEVEPPVELDNPTLSPAPYTPYWSLAERLNKSSGVLLRPKAAATDSSRMPWHTISPAHPKCIYMTRFWEDHEADTLLKWAGNKIARSTVVGSKGQGHQNDVRTSEGMFLTHHSFLKHPIIVKARERVSLMTGLPPENVEATQILRYEAGQRYLAHPDYFQTIYTEHLARGGQRVATIIAWLSDTESGGNTSFPTSRDPNTKKPYTVAPKKGDGIVFWSCGPEMTADTYCKPDPFSQHFGEPPVGNATKWVSVFWVRQREFH